MVAGLAVVAVGCTSTRPGYVSDQAAFGLASTSTTPPTAGAAVPQAPATTAAPAPVVLAWLPCQKGQGPLGDQCATLQVPLDYQHPEGPTIGIALARHLATGAKVGSLLLNPGGPGASGVDGLVTEMGILSPSLISHFDLIGFDPRGVARSAPVRCASGPQLDQYFDLDPAPTTDAGFDALIQGDRQFVQGCDDLSANLLPHVGTADAARDMDEIRQAVGEAKLNYFGFSYGSLLGATYAELFPTHIRAMVLDGAIDPAEDPISFNLGQAVAFNAELNAFFADCASRPACTWKPGVDLRRAYDSLMAGLKVHRLPGIGARTLGPGEAFYGVALPLYDRSEWPDLATALQRAERGDGSLLLRFSDLYTTRNTDGSYSNEQEANTAVNCLDQAWPKDPAVVRAAAVQAQALAPEFGVADLYGGLTCTLWPVPATRSPHPIAAAGSPPIVVIGSTGDPATPYAGAQALAGELSQGVLLTRVGDGHTGYRSSACIRASVDPYLLDLTVPPKSTTCSSP
jgi:pimeloyl-ACP methyl ester carboxylesterase